MTGGSGVMGSERLEKDAANVIIIIMLQREEVMNSLKQRPINSYAALGSEVVGGRWTDQENQAVFPQRSSR
ncbi:unnamed protein product [Brassica rapa subsp. narinosa]|uniref:(rape) hypothetical protein n=1 Tax=Brassica napus TaxID=3708 RepID=A0A816ZWI7_BRANA|nr:unnamed protein product [Brassica napus]